MSDTITVQTNIIVSFPSVGQNEQSAKSYSGVPLSSVLHLDEQAVPTTAAGTVVPMGAVSPAGVIQFTNLDPTNFCEVGIQNGGTFFPLIKLLPGNVLGSSAQFYVADGVTPYYRGNTSAPKVEFMVAQR